MLSRYRLTTPNIAHSINWITSIKPLIIRRMRYKKRIVYFLISALVGKTLYRNLKSLLLSKNDWTSKDNVTSTAFDL